MQIKNMKKKNTPSVGQSGAQSVRLPGQFSRSVHQQHRSLSLAQVLAAIRGRVCRQWGFTEVVGQWVWVHASDTLTSLERAWLFELGFHWSPRRRAYQHPCGVSSSPSREPFATYFPAEHESQPLEFMPHF